MRNTFENTTLFHGTPASTQLKKRHWSPCPACNAQQRQEPLATDTVHLDASAIDDGSKVAQTLVSTESCIMNVFGMKTEAQLINSFEDIIRKRGAMDMLISDSARVEISNRVQDALRGYSIRAIFSAPELRRTFAP